MSTSGPAERRFGRLAAQLLTVPNVGEGTGFGSNPGLRVGGKIFAMLVRGELVVKLPRERVNALAAAGSGTRFDPGHGRLMKEWVSVPMQRGVSWEALANEALDFVRPTRGPRGG